MLRRPSSLPRSVSCLRPLSSTSDQGRRPPVALGQRERNVSSAAPDTQPVSNAQREELVLGYRQWGYRHAITSPFKGPTNSPLVDIIGRLKPPSEQLEELNSVYCGGVGVQYAHIPCLEKQEFLTRMIEDPPKIAQPQVSRVHETLVRSENLDRWLASKFSNLKQYSGEGAEATLAFCQLLFELCPSNQVGEVVIAIAHRGRISLLTELLNFPYERLLRKYSGLNEFNPSEKSIGDVLSHLWQSVDLEQPDGGSVHVSLLPNPSHLEVANSVALGKVRAKMNNLGSAPFYGDSVSSPLALLIHGDAAFIGQGISYENAQMSKLPGYSTGGSIHLITNNLIGFTSDMDNQGSTFGAGDIGKMYDVPVITVNGLDVDAVHTAVTMAMSYRARFQEDVIVDLHCYRLHGHNQHDEPRFTNPRMYRIVERLAPLHQNLDMPTEAAETIVAAQTGELNEALQQCREYTPPRVAFTGNWKHISQAGHELTTWDTGYPVGDLRRIGLKSVEVPAGFSYHPTLDRAHIKKRTKMMETGSGIDWAMGEALAMGSLLLQGYSVRLSGEDVTRGTFSNRHVILYDQETEEPFTGLNHLQPDQSAQVEAVDSLLSEEAVVGFEYGYSLESPDTLCLWEAQFGDFFNPAQVMYDQFVVCGEAKWLLQTGLVSLLPHGYDGNGPDHTSARLERWLQLSDSKEEGVDGDDVNVQVVNLTTPAQYYHLLRRQMIRPFRKPVIVMSPKALLRSPDAVSKIEEFAPGTTFRRVIGDTVAQPDQVKRVLVCSGRHYYTLSKHRSDLADSTTAIVRVEEICPFPAAELQAELSKYPQAEVVWAQEESRNGGAWSFVSTRVKNILGVEMEYAGRRECAAAAVGVASVHAAEVKEILASAFSHCKQ